MITPRTPRYKNFSVAETLQALAVELIRRLWDRGLYRTHPIAKKIHANWFDLWVDWRTQIEMRSVDAQAADLVRQWEEEDKSDEFIFSETVEGETPLGGEMQLSAPFKVRENAHP